MGHKTLINGTSYGVTGGKSLVSGTSYNICSGKTLINGTVYSIRFSSDSLGGPPTAMLYSDGDLVFQYGNRVASGKTLTASYTGFEEESYTSTSVPWNSQKNKICNVYFNDKISPINLANWFNSCVNMKTFVSDNLDMNGVTSLYGTFNNCRNLTGYPICGENVTTMHTTYNNCQKLTGSPVCGSKVTNMYYTYNNCSNITGSPVCGENVTTLYSTYNNCQKLTGSPVCGSKVTSMSSTYLNCKNITGSPVCGENVTSMASAYENCYKLTGIPVCGNKVTNMRRTYYNCQNLASGNAYFYSPSVSSMWGCFQSKNNKRRLNIYVPSGSTTNTHLHYTNTYTTSLVGVTNIVWTDTGTYQYNTKYNVYIYPVSNVAQARIDNGD